MRRQELPSLHVDVSRVYEPADDTFLMLDALAAEVHTMPRGIALEIGSGSGCLSIGLALASKLGDDSASASLHLAVDLSPDANAATAANAAANGVTLHVVQMDLAAALRSGLIDVLIFNPPYVPTSTEEALEGQQQRDISAAWAGGPRGRVVLDQLLPHVGSLLSASGGFYLLGVRENDPDELASVLGAQGLRCRIIAERRAQNERLFVLRAHRDLA